MAVAVRMPPDKQSYSTRPNSTTVWVLVGAVLVLLLEISNSCYGNHRYETGPSTKSHTIFTCLCTNRPTSNAISLGSQYDHLTCFTPRDSSRFGEHRITLTSEERGELARKFKYYHKSVRPSDRFNLVETINGTYFSLTSELEILQTRRLDETTDAKLHLELLLIVHFHDDRLVLRELPEIVTLPDEFQPWLPVVDLVQSWGSTSSGAEAFSVHKTLHLDPKTGQITLFYRISGSVACFSSAWKRPFERHYCELEFGTEKNERLFLRVVRDLRPSTQLKSATHSIEEWPNLVIRFNYSTQWQFAIVSVYLPSLLIFSVTLFAQWKRRKVQVLVSVTSIICIVVIQTAQRNPTTNSITMQELWLSALLIHLICILTVDLLLPSRRIVYNAIDSNNNGANGNGTANKSLYFSKKRIAVPTSAYRKASPPGDVLMPHNQQQPIYRQQQSPYMGSDVRTGGRQVRFQQAQAPGVHEQLVLDMSAHSIPLTTTEEEVEDQEEDLILFTKQSYSKQADLIHPAHDEEEEVEEEVNTSDEDVTNSREPIWLGAEKSAMSLFRPNPRTFQYRRNPPQQSIPITIAGRNRRSSSVLYPSMKMLKKSSSHKLSSPLSFFQPAAQKKRAVLTERQVYRVTVGRKKRIALTVIFTSFVVFVVGYVGLAIYALRS